MLCLLDVDGVVPNGIGKAQISAYQLSVGYHAAGNHIGYTQDGQLLILGMKPGFHGCRQVSVVVNIHRHMIALFQEGFDINVMPLELGDKADDPIQVNDAPHSQTDANQPIGAGRDVADQLINGKINLLVYMRECLPADWNGLAADDLVIQIREDEAKAAGADINGNAVSCLAVQGKDDGAPPPA